jgi:hypothetical protein
MKSWPQVKEQLIRYKFRTTIRERDVVNRGERKEEVEHVEQSFDFPSPAEVEFIPSEDPKMPPGLLIKKLTPNILLSWKLNAAGDVEENISYVDPPKVVVRKTVPKEPVAKTKTDPARPAASTAAKAEDNPTAKKGTIRVGPSTGE